MFIARDRCVGSLVSGCAGLAGVTLITAAVVFGVQLISAVIYRFAAAFGAADATGGTRVLLALLGVFSLIIGLHAVRHVLITIVGPARERTVDARPCHSCLTSDMMVRCAPGNDGCLMMSALSCWPSCSFGTLSWPPRQKRLPPRCWSWKINRNSMRRSRPNCGRYVPTGQCPSTQNGDGC